MCACIWYILVCVCRDGGLYDNLYVCMCGVYVISGVAGNSRLAAEVGGTSEITDTSSIQYISPPIAP